MERTESKVKSPEKMAKVKRILLGGRGSYGVLGNIFIYMLLIGIGFVYLYPLLYILVNSMKDLEDLLNPMVKWIPTHIYFSNYEKAFKVLNYVPTLTQTLYVVLLSTIAQVISSSLIGYGFARYNFKGKNFFFILMIVTFLIPQQTLMIPRFLMFQKLGLLNSVLSFFVPATFGQGLNQALFILIFYQLFRMIPKSLEEAAKIDGANDFTVFARISLPLATPAFVISFVLSMVWYWNETYLSSLYFGNAIKTLPMQLQSFVDSYRLLFPSGAVVTDRLNESVRMAGTLLTIAPLLIIYFIVERWLRESIDSVGITGE
ncbi:MAG TPA: carbohydrate ABC transporter permease [Fervidobacterium sp.]|jgi:multiple sugar transport system permease protein|nr:carbohydrate ABC transporter permease [Fervidobacterium sp.]HOL03629.1 carbohydrate ABC transporter permease [Fervidobacterium sp.]HON03989.1 carbohydrate ABC transporter permease [Fervidobacterium sp.]HOS51858.1 carbohydrate ABC transporter permease [Fervidobacterium sp.]HPC78853.1 carbohydrate ABC transporter permease [Fervidobacterium sp.]